MSRRRAALLGWWIGILGVHVVAACFYITTGAFYRHLEFADLQNFFLYFRIGMDNKHNHTIALVHFACALPHVFYALGMIGATLKSRRLKFQIASDSNQQRKPRLGNQSHPASNAANSQAKKLVLLAKARSSGILDGILAFISVSGRYYDIMLVVHELVETSLHTVQAYKMSRLLPRVTINRTYVVFIVLNCWLTVLLRIIYAKRAANERLFSLFCDCVLDLVISIAIIVAIAKSYVDDYDWNTNGFPRDLLVNDRWLAYAINELKIVIVSSWTDLIARAVFAVGVCVALSDMKAILSAGRSLVRIEIEPNDKASTTLKNVGPFTNSIGNASPKRGELKKRSGTRLLDFIEANPRTSHMLNKVVKIAFGVWGLVILVLHIQAESVPTVHCMQVRPWGATRPYCSFVDVSCKHLHISGYAKEMERLWQAIGFATVERIRVRHCPHLEFPSILQKFSSLYFLKIYNSTIVRWDDNAAITKSTHPRIAYLHLIRVSFSNGTLPAGLLSPNMPPSLLDITICASNLKQVPDDLDTIWPKGIIIVLELGELSSVPSSIIRLKPFILSLYGNPVTSLPSSLFEIECLHILEVGETLIDTLPEQVDKPSPSLRQLFLSDTLVSTFNAWVDKLVPSLQLVASGTPYCTAYEWIQNGSATQFPSNSASNASLSVLMDAKNHWSTINQVLTCDSAQQGPFYPIIANDVAASEE